MNSQHSQQSSVSSSTKTFSTVSTTATIVSTYWTILELLESDPINLQLLESLCNELFELRIRNKLNSEIKEVIDELRGAYNSRLGGIKLDFQARIIPEYIEQKNSIDDEEENGTVEHDDQGNAEGLEKELEDEWLSPIIISDTDAKNEMEKSVEALSAEAFTLKIVEAKNRLSSVIF